MPKQLEENGITSEHVEFNDESLVKVIKNFTLEAGLPETSNVKLVHSAEKSL